MPRDALLRARGAPTQGLFVLPVSVRRLAWEVVSGADDVNLGPDPNASVKVQVTSMKKLLVIGALAIASVAMSVPANAQGVYLGFGNGPGYYGSGGYDGGTAAIVPAIPMIILTLRTIVSAES